MNLITTSTNTIFPYVTSLEILDVNILFAQGSWINLPNFKASWVDFGNSNNIETINFPTFMGLSFRPNFNNEFIVESSESDYYEEYSFDVKPNNVDNKVKTTRAAYCYVQQPKIDVLPATKIMTGLTSGSTGIILVDSPSAQTFTFSFSGDVSVFSGYNMDFKFSIYKYYEINQKFLKPPVYESPIIERPTFESLMAFNTTLDFKNFADSEYLVRGSFVYPYCTPSAKLLGLKINTSDYMDVGNSYITYNNVNDWYFAYITKSPKPIVIGGFSTLQQNGFFNVQTLPIVTSAITYYLQSTPSGEVQVNVNGVTLQPGTDYTFSSNYITLSGPLLDTDILTVAYIVNALGENSNVETYVVPSSIPSNTYPSLGQRLIYNTTSNRYEFWLNSPCDGNVIFSLNGVTLSQSEYLVSNSNQRRIILYFTPSVNDVITVFYTSLLPSVLGVTSNPVGVSFFVSPIPQKNNGYFILEFYDYSDITLSNLLFSGTTDFIPDVSTYSISTSVPTSYGFVAGQKFWYRIKSVKNYQLFNGDIITTNNYSDTLEASLNNNGIYNY